MAHLLPDVAELTKRLLAEGGTDVYGQIIAAVDAAVLVAAASVLDRNQVRLAKALGISRTTIRSKIKRSDVLLDGRRKPTAPPAA